MNRVPYYLLFFAPPLALSVVFAAMLLVWHHRLNTGTLDPETRVKITRRCTVFARVLKHFGWAYLLMFLLVAVAQKIMRHE